jgi:hypothetical protein
VLQRDEPINHEDGEKSIFHIERNSSAGNGSKQVQNFIEQKKEKNIHFFSSSIHLIQEGKSPHI